MGFRRDNGMGRFSVELEVANNDDLAVVRRGLMKPEEARRLRMVGVVDPGATRLVLPVSVVDQLGLARAGRTRVQYADGRIGKRDMATGVWLELQGRSGLFDAIVEPKRTTALLGAIVLEVLDFVVDCTAQRLLPRDPRAIFSELE